MTYSALIAFTESIPDRVFCLDETIIVTVSFPGEYAGGLQVSDIRLPGGLAYVPNSVFKVPMPGDASYVSQMKIQVQVVEGSTTLNSHILLSKDDYYFFGSPFNVGVNATSAAFSIDGVRPTLAIGVPIGSDQWVTGAEGVAITFDFSENVVGFSESDIHVDSAIGTISGFTQLSGSQYTAIFTPNASVYTNAASLSVDFGAYTDTAGNHGLGALFDTLKIDTLTRSDIAPPRPTIGLATSLAGASGMDFTVSFGETVTGFGVEDIALPASLNNSSVVQTSPLGDAKTFTFHLVPDANNPINESSAVINVLAGGYADLSGNAGVSATSSNFAIDTTAPEIIYSVVSDSVLSTSEVVAVSWQFSEPVMDFDVSDIDFSSAAVQLLSFGSAGPNTYHMLFAPLPNTAQAVNTITVLGAHYTDAAGNAGVDYTMPAFSVDTVAPFPTITSDTDISGAAGFGFVVSFAEPVENFGVGDIIVSGISGTVSAVSQSPDGMLYKFYFTPNAGEQSENASLSVAAGDYADLAGNTGAASDAFMFVVDSTSPQATITLNDLLLTTGESLSIAVTFNERVTGFDASDIDLGGAVGTLSEFILNPLGTYLARFTPADGVTSSGHVISLTGPYADWAGNAGLTAMSAAFSIDTKAPSLSIGVSDTNLTQGESLTLTFAFSEAVTGFSATDVLLDGAAITLTNVMSADGGRTYTATYTPATGMLDPNNVFSVAAGTYTDLAGNTGSGAASSNVAIDTVGKTLFGTDGNDVLCGTAGADRLSGIPQSSTLLGKGSLDVLLGGAGADVFVLGDARGAFYDDGSSKSPGVKDFATIADFSAAQGDKIQLKAGTYFQTAMSVGKISGTGLYLDTNSTHTLDVRDELIGFVVGVTPDSLSTSTDFVYV